MLKGLSIIAVVSLVFFLKGCAGNLEEEEEEKSYKLLMPSVYEVRLEPGEYWIWAFVRWSKRGVLDGKYPDDLKVNDSNGQPITLERFKDSISYKDRDHTGERLWRIHLETSGSYKVSCADSSRFILIIARRENHFRGAGSEIVFHGLEED